MKFMVSAFILLFMFFYAGADIANRWLKMAYILSCIVFSAGLFLYIMHMFYGRECLSIGSIACLLLFGSNFINYSKKNLQDYLLLAWLVFSAIHYTNPEIHDEYRWYIHNIASILLWANVLYAVYLQFKSVANDE